MSTTKDFEQFVRNISITRQQRSKISTMNKAARSYLSNHPEYKKILDSSILIGSYKKGTMTRPLKGSKTDCDIMVIADHKSNVTPEEALKVLYSAIADNKDWPKPELFPFCITLDYPDFSIDFALAKRNKRKPGTYLSAIRGEWKPDDPQGRYEYIRSLNSQTKGKYTKAVKALKWWRKLNVPSGNCYPHGVTLEYLAIEANADPKLPLEEYFIETLKGIYKKFHNAKKMPVIKDKLYPYDDMLSRYTYEDFMVFISCIGKTLEILETQGHDNKTWRKILGDRFPK